MNAAKSQSREFFVGEVHAVVAGDEVRLDLTDDDGRGLVVRFDTLHLADIISDLRAAIGVGDGPIERVAWDEKNARVEINSARTFEGKFTF